MKRLPFDYDRYWPRDKEALKRHWRPDIPPSPLQWALIDFWNDVNRELTTLSVQADTATEYRALLRNTQQEFSTLVNEMGRELRALRLGLQSLQQEVNTLQKALAEHQELLVAARSRGEIL